MLLAALLTAASHANAQSAPAAPAAKQEPLRVFVSIRPQVEFVRQVGGSRVAVDVLVGPGQSHHTFEPTPRQLALLSQARIYFSMGLPFETPLLPRIRANCPGIEIVDCARGVERRTMRAEELGGAGHEHHDHAPGEACSHDAGEADPHLWLDPRRACVMVRNIADDLARLDPDSAAAYRASARRYTRELEQLDARLERELQPFRGRKFFVFHPAYGYLADRYGLIQMAIEIAGREPGPRELASVMEQAKSDGVRVIFVQPQFTSGAARAVAEAIGGTVVAMDPLAENYVENMTAMGEQLVAALRASGESGK